MKAQQERAQQQAQAAAMQRACGNKRTVNRQKAKKVATAPDREVRRSRATP